MTDTASDIRAESWLIRWAPPGVRPYLTLARLDRPIGTWLLLYPCWWGLAMPPRPAGFGWIDLWYGVLFGVGALVMRGAGCTVNDILDRDFDARVARTRTRPIPSGAVSPTQAVLFLIAQLLLGFLVLIQFNSTTVGLGIASLVLVFTYPLMKRITWWPQAFLGLAFNWGALVGWTAVAGELALPSLLLYAAGICWTLGYDTIYALQDIEDDARIGIKSTARLFGGATRRWVAGFYALTVLGIGAAGLSAGLEPLPFLLLLAAGAAQLAWQVAMLAADRPADCLVKFKSNRWFGLLVLAGLLAGRALA
ncbi:4-hydroxybenzoate octaprenyltransferase [Inquilinus limosus]|uniref:4-hydroxybenzoate octaprenyltransferase n=1 Tax=Inquilinus limosus TaxID=171674 RepID=UPI0004040193|nr:4-hydroxybenzoate octaprenyltransferase [Inquilinus limosus]